MMKFLKIIGCSLLAMLIVLSFKIFYPRSYHVPPFEKRLNTEYWTLSTGSKIGYTFISGKGQKKSFPIIYLHGGPGAHINNYDIKLFTSVAESGYDVYLYDQIGSGQSARLDYISGYTVERHIDDLNDIIQKINAPQVILVGQSWGGILAALFAAHHSQKINRIIFTCPGPIFPIHQDLGKISPPDSVHLRQPFYTNQEGNKIANNSRTEAMSFFATRFGVKIASDKEADEFATYLNYEVNKSTVCDTANILGEDPGSGYYAQVMTFNSLIKIKDQRSAIEQLTIPVLVIKGECDNQRWGFTKEYLDLFKNSELKIIPHAGHFISVEQPQLYKKTIVAFLERTAN